MKIRGKMCPKYIYLFILVCMYVSMWGMYTLSAVPMEVKTGWEIPLTGVTNDCKVSNMGIRNETLQE